MRVNRHRQRLLHLLHLVGVEVRQAYRQLLRQVGVGFGPPHLKEVEVRGGETIGTKVNDTRQDKIGVFVAVTFKTDCGTERTREGAGVRGDNIKRSVAATCAPKIELRANGDLVYTT